MLPSEYPEVQGYPNLKHFLGAHVDMQFEDVRDLIRMPAYTLRSGMNFTAAARLFDLISGCSICFYNSEPDKLCQLGISKQEFRAVLRDYFPLNSIPVPEEEALDVLWVWSRNPLAHVLGVDVRPDAPTIDVQKKAWPLKRVLELENSEDLPEWIAPPLTGGSGHYAISVGGLFWGVHRMLHALFSDSQQAQAADGTAVTIPV